MKITHQPFFVFYRGHKQMLPKSSAHRNHSAHRFLRLVKITSEVFKGDGNWLFRRKPSSCRRPRDPSSISGTFRSSKRPMNWSVQTSIGISPHGGVPAIASLIPLSLALLRQWQAARIQGVTPPPVIAVGFPVRKSISNRNSSLKWVSHVSTRIKSYTQVIRQSRN
jgi:hypothetical protein